ncbi:hypothetical protein ACFPU0_11785 [Pseudomonas sp. GCM10022186]|uniref:hypothetical protein n=1 Tax=Pseudomonas sp. GCM10022186 TaxID=3252650 RepID=UPI0036129451
MTSLSGLSAFRVREFRAATLGYFGHIWEFYTFWTIVPLIVANAPLATRFPELGVSGLSFRVIGVGALGTLLGGFLSQRLGSARVAMGALPAVWSSRLAGASCRFPRSALPHPTGPALCALSV